VKKKEFLHELEASLSGLDSEEKRAAIEYYDELISEKAERRISEEETVRALGNVKSVAKTVRARAAGERQRAPKKSGNGLVSNAVFIGKLFSAPILLPLGFAFYVTFFTLFVTGVALVISFGAGAAGLIIGAIPALIYEAMRETFVSGLMLFGVAMASGGILGLLFILVIKFWFVPIRVLLKGITALLVKIYGGKK
jgi:uncharacterized membrane protein